MGETRVYADKSAEISFSVPSAHYNSQQAYNYGTNQGYLALGFSIPEALKYKRISSFVLNVYIINWPFGSSETIYSSIYGAPFNPNTVTYNTRPSVAYFKSYTIHNLGIPGYKGIIFDVATSGAKEALTNGVELSLVNQTIYTDKGLNRPYLAITHDDQIIGMSVSTNYIYQAWSAIDTTFSWSTAPQITDTLMPVATASTVFRWRSKGASSYHEISCGTNTQIAIPGGTFAGLAAIEWQVAVTANSGIITTSSWAEISVADPVIYGASPSSGYIDENVDNTFRWRTAQTAGYTTIFVAQASAVFRWRNTEGDTIHTISLATEESVTIPAGTFVADTVQWQVTTVSKTGVATTSDWFPLSTVEVLSTAQAISPDNVILDGTKPAVFAWKHIISTGTEQTAAELQISPDNATFTTLVRVSGNASTYVAQANTLTAGELYWRVRTYNTDRRPGSWSNVAHVVVVAAPAAPSVQLETVSPRPVIRWQAEGQQAYEVITGATSSGIKFGADKSYQPKKPLPDGEHTISVRVQNKFGLWSEWGKVAVTVKNAPGDDITMAVKGGYTAHLQWSSATVYSRYIVVRDGKWIAETTDLSYTDNFSIGVPQYQIIGFLSDGVNYAVSNLDTVQIQCDTVVIAEVDNPVWQRLGLSESSSRQISARANQTVRYIHYTGSPLPSAEVGEAVDKSISFDCAFLHSQQDQADALEALMGRVVCVKTAQGQMAVGVLGGYSLKATRFYRAYSCTVTDIAWKEEITK